MWIPALAEVVIGFVKEVCVEKNMLFALYTIHYTVNTAHCVQVSSFDPSVLVCNCVLVCQSVRVDAAGAA